MTDSATQLSSLTKRQMLEEALNVALSGDWEKSLENSNQFLERFPRDAEALNRKGRALLELGRLQESWDAYSEALNVDPANMIARRNLQRLEMLANTDATIEPPEEPVASPRGAVFVEEIGKTWVDELTRAADESVLATVSPGEQLTFEVRNGSVLVHSRTGALLGELEERIAHRLIDLLDAGNRYEMYALGMSGHSLRFILRETYRDQTNAAVTGLPRQSRTVTDLMREREILFQREEGDFTFGDEEDEDELVDEDVDDDEQDVDEDDGIDEEAAAYVDSSVADSEEDEM